MHYLTSVPHKVLPAGAPSPRTDRLIANVEVSINRVTFLMQGIFGGAPNWPDFSIKDNNQSCV